MACSSLTDISPDGGLFVAASEHEIRLWRLNTKDERGLLPKGTPSKPPCF